MSPAQCAVEECSHLAPGDRIVWAEPVVRRRVAPTGDVRRRQRRDVPLEQMTLGIHEIGLPGGKAERSIEERSHLTSAYVRIGTEPVVRRRIAPTGDAVG